MTFHFIKIHILFLIFSAFSNSYCQTADSVKSAWSATVSMNGLYQSGNTNKIYISGKSEIKNSGNVIETILASYLGYGESNFKKDNNDFYTSLTADLFYKNRWSPFLLQYVEYNYSSGIDFRSQSGAGLKYILIQSDDHKTSISAACIYDYTNLTSIPGNSKIETPRLSVRFKTRQMLLSGKLIFSFVSFYQPSLEKIENAIFRCEASLEVPITKSIFVNAVYKYTDDDIVSAGRKRSDTKLTFGAGYSF
ncbi:MAG: DUF481 domain-containing protein [Ignavibacteria bacterium]|nr:DUF481 domain-containing protein [Ignavibacteria bacterium]MBL0106069.1 DUF481 domain-containing protein [Ignavibacteria bacterium]